MVSIHVKNLQLLMTEIYKTKSGLSPPFMKDIFTVRNTGYNLRHGNDSLIPKVRTTTHGIETISFLGNRLWSTLPNIVKQASTLPIFKNHIKGNVSIHKDRVYPTCQVIHQNIGL